MKSPTTIKRNIVVVENLKIDNSKKSRQVLTYLDFLFYEQTTLLIFLHLQ